MGHSRDSNDLIEILLQCYALCYTFHLGMREKKHGCWKVERGVKNDNL
jgi:hypothetical protein